VAADQTNRTTKKERRDWKPAFLKALADTGNVKLACYKASIGRAAAYHAYHRSEEFAKLWDQAIEDSVDMLEAEARRRAVGFDVPVYYKGQTVGAIKQYSDVLMIVLLKGHRPEKYRDNYDIEKFINAIARTNPSALPEPLPKAKGRRAKGTGNGDTSG
jgi:hypothetical protein